ncbi:MAG TPA: cobalt-precorrin-5B (C(1))-methyltransferase CbiD [Clostridia bacterium]
MEDYVVINSKKLRKGYTTGSCAAAASKAAVIMLLSKKIIDTVIIDTPSGVKLNLLLSNIELNDSYATCSVIKDGGDDPDMTSGLHIFAKARFVKSSGIEILSGEGIGIVTLPGLKVKVGKPAINPIPMSMILKEVGEVLPCDKGVEITLSVPGGKEIAKKTFNPRLGIIDGISILGTTGIVTPMSEEAWKESISMELDIAIARGFKDIVFTFGNYGESFCIESMGISQDRIIKISNFVGFMLDKASERGLESILLAGHLGKMVKVAAGIFNTHSRVADARMEILCAYAALEGASTETVRKIYECTTTDAAASVIEKEGINAVFQRITDNVVRRCSLYTFGKVKFGAVLFNEYNSLLSISQGACEILSKIGEKK